MPEPAGAMTYEARNVCNTSVNSVTLSRYALIDWINGAIGEKRYSKAEQLCDGYGYCVIMNQLFPGVIAEAKIKRDTVVDVNKLWNLKQFQMAFSRCRVSQDVPINLLIKGKYQDNYEFAQWFKKFYDTNDRHDNGDNDENQFSKAKESGSHTSVVNSSHVSERPRFNVVPFKNARKQWTPVRMDKNVSLAEYRRMFTPKRFEMSKKVLNEKDTNAAEDAAQSGRASQPKTNSADEIAALTRTVERLRCENASLQGELAAAKSQIAAPNGADRSLDDDDYEAMALKLRKIADDFGDLVSNAPDDAVEIDNIVSIFDLNGVPLEIESREVASRASFE